MNNLDIMRFIVGNFTSFSPKIEFLSSLFFVKPHKIRSKKNSPTILLYHIN